MRVNLQKDSVYLDIGSLHFEAYAKSDLPEHVTPVFTFGMSEHIIDVPSFAIRDLTIRETRDGGKYYHFPLNASAGNIVDDDTFSIQGRVTNPIWLIGESLQWEHILSMSSRKVSAVGYDEFNKEFYIVNRDSLYTYGLRTDIMNKIRN